MYAIIRDRGRQYKVREGDVLQLDLFADKAQDDKLEFDVLLTSDGEGKVQVGRPLVAGAKVNATVVAPDLKGDKLDVVHFHRRNDSMKMVGHRQRYTRVRIDAIVAAAQSE